MHAYLYTYVFFALSLVFSFFFFNDTATTEIYTLSLHDALPILYVGMIESEIFRALADPTRRAVLERVDRKSTRLNSSHMSISYAVFCLKKKKKETEQQRHRRHPHQDSLRQVCGISLAARDCPYF